MIVTVTLNAAVDRTLTVPNFQTGHRHRASASLTSAGGKGINVARALKRLDSPVIATGLAGGRTGDRIIDELAGEAILNDFVRISDESRTSTALVDPTAGTLSEVYEWGPAVRPDELETLLDKLHYLSRVASYVVFSGSLPRDVDDDFYAEAIRDLNKRGVQCVLDTEGEPLRIGVEAEPFLVSPNQREAESLVGQEFSDDEDFLVALDTIADLGARNVLITQETSCFGLFREDETLRRFRASIPRVEPVASVGAGDVLLAGFLAARFNGSRSTTRCARRSAARRRRSSSSARAASTRARRSGSRRASSSKSSSRSPLSRARDVERADARAVLQVLGPGEAAAFDREADRRRAGGDERPHAAGGDVDGADRAADVEDDELVAHRQRRARRDRDRHRAGAASRCSGAYQARRSPSGVRSSVASTCGESAIAIGVPRRVMLEITRPLTASTTSIGRSAPATGLPSFVIEPVATYATRPPDAATATAPSCPGSASDGCRPTTRKTPPPAIFIAHGVGAGETAGLVHVVDRRDAVHERRPVAGDPAEPEPGAALRVRELLEAALAPARSPDRRRRGSRTRAASSRAASRGRSTLPAIASDTGDAPTAQLAGDVARAGLLRQLGVQAVGEGAHVHGVAALGVRREPGDDRAVLREGRDRAARTGRRGSTVRGRPRRPRRRLRPQARPRLRAARASRPR